MSLHPDDQMWHQGADWYHTVGEHALHAAQRVIQMQGLSTVAKILNVPCGHGREGRYLRAAFPDAELTFCDIDRSGVDFCADEFDGLALYSEIELTDLTFVPEYDLIWVGSLFTHLDFDRTKKWLGHLCTALADDGVLVATFHGAWTIEIQRTAPLIDEISWRKILHGYNESGYGYAPYASGEPVQDWGVSLSKPSAIVSIVEELPNVRLLSYNERGWANNHDVLGVAKTDRLKPW